MQHEETERCLFVLMPQAESVSLSLRGGLHGRGFLESALSIRTLVTGLVICAQTALHSIFKHKICHYYLKNSKNKLKPHMFSRPLILHGSFTFMVRVQEEVERGEVGFLRF